ncbi:type II toxin-antitoxin system VapC family toxin [Mitsuaria sp. GD03876]|uniref:type II toxin-antitoxin system VapC family toxin n=1 Tax=Mitsuaria sp. GD03876 TaxID=2975399 RepID=UPI00244D44B4|nr:type II toxin-antitoxin system VapC family toxin [Mitsuaria sp. GD03876]MDH0863588.1 type II toxin-antitoxin system VapC family toxin [Mitsuaria sp. GD03876]
MKTVVVDSNVALGWLVLRKDNEALHRYAGRLAESSATAETRLIAPYVFTAECAYTLLKRGRAQGWPEEELQMYAELIDMYPVAMDEDVMPLPEHVDFAMEHNVQGYDALYLALAMEKKAALATADKGLRAAAERAGVELF